MLPGIHPRCTCRVRLDEFEPFWAAQRAAALLRAGLPANSTSCPPLNPDPQPVTNTTTATQPQHSSNGLVIGLAVGGGFLVVAVCCALLLAKHRGFACISRKAELPSQGSLNKPLARGLTDDYEGPPPHGPQPLACAAGSRHLGPTAPLRGSPLHSSSGVAYADASSSSVQCSSSGGLSSEAHSSPFAVFLAGQQAELSSSASGSEPLRPLSSLSMNTHQQQQQQQQQQHSSGLPSVPPGQASSGSSCSHHTSGQQPVASGSAGSNSGKLGDTLDLQMSLGADG